MNRFNNILYQLKLKAIHAGFKLRHSRQRKMLLMNTKYRFFLFDRQWSMHPVFKYIYPKPGVPRRIAVCVTAFLLVGAGYALHLYNTANADWYDTGWVYRKAITINPTKIAGSLTDFPVLINLTDSSLLANAQPSANDVLFTSSDGTTKLKHEIENYATASGQLMAWVKVPSVSSTSATTIYMYYGNPNAQNQQDPVNVWDSSYKAVWHLNQDPGLAGTDGIKDSTINHNDGTDAGTMDSSDLVPGKLGYGLDFDGSDDNIGLTTSGNVHTTSENRITFSGWGKYDVAPSGDGFAFIGGGGAAAINTEVYINTSTELELWEGAPRSTNYRSMTPINVGTGNYAYYTATVDTINDKGRLYVNGVLVKEFTYYSTSIPGKSYIGQYTSGASQDQWDGVLDEVRVSSVVRSPEWIQTEYTNQSDPANFITVGKQQQKKNPVLYWKFDEGAGFLVGDTSDKNNKGTISGATWASKDVCLFESNCLKFDGTNDYVRRLHDGSADAWCNISDGNRGCTATWSARMKIVFAGNTATSNLTNFPVLVKLDSTRVDYSKFAAGGTDVRFVDMADPSAILPHEIETWNSGGDSYIWVKVPQIDAYSKSDYIWMYYGNTAPPQAQQPRSVWEGNYTSVMHLKESGNGTTAEYKDSTTNFQSGTGGNGTAAEAPTRQLGILGFGQNFDGSVDWIDGDQSTGPISGLAAYTVEAWIKPDGCGEGTDPNKEGTIWKQFGANSIEFDVCDQVYGDLNVWLSSGNQAFSQGSVVATNSAVWSHVAVVHNGSGTISMYVNGQSVIMSDASVTANASVGNYVIGADCGTGGTCSTINYKGMIDELRTSNTARTAEWLRAEYLTGLDQFNAYIPEGTDPKMDPGTSSFSVGTWFRHPATISGQDTLISRTDTLTGIGYKVYFDATAGLCFGISGTSGSFPTDRVCSKNTYNDNMWHYVEGVKSGTSSITIFVDGQQISQDSSITSSSLTGVASPFYVGIDADGASNPWDGYIDEVRVYDYARSAAEVKADYNAKGAALGLSTSIGITDPKNSLNQGLVGYWKMDDGKGYPCASGVDKACDSSGNGNVGTWNGQVASASGKFGYGTTYDGTTDYVSLSDNAIFTPSGDMSVSFWVNFTQLSSARAADTMLVYKTDNLDPFFSYQIYQNLSNDTISVGWGNTSRQELYTNSNTALTANTWYHVMFVKTGTQGRIYINGTDDTKYSTSDALTGTTLDSDQTLNFGAVNDGSKSLRGKMDDVRLYNRALSPREATNLYDWAPAPVGWWKLDDHNKLTASDSGTAGFTGTWNGTGPKDGPGKHGAGGTFNGTDDYIDLGNQDKLFSPTYTVEAWFRVKGSPTSGNTKYIFSDFDVTGGTASFNLQVDTVGDLNFWFENPSGTTNSVSYSTIQGDTWYHVAGSWDGTTRRLYVNGKLVDSDATAQTFADVGGNATIGRSGSWNGSRNFRGDIDDVKYYNYARSIKQIVQDMNGNHPAVGSPIGSALVHYKLDDGYGNVASNSGSLGSGANINLFNFSNPATYGSGWTNNGKFGKALNFDGSNDYADKRSITGLPALNDPQTISLWYKVGSNPAAEQVLFSLDSGSGNATQIEFTGTGSLGATDSNGPSGLLQVAPAPTANTWHHVLWTWDGTTGTLYLDGGKKITSTRSPMTASGSRILLGNYNGGAGGSFKGTIDEVKLYSYALNANEVKVDYNQGKALMLGSLSTNPDGTASNSAARKYCPPGDSGGNCAGTGVLNPAPVGEWKLDDRIGSTVQDSSGNNFNGYFSGRPSWIGAKVGAGLQFDGIDDKVIVPHNTSLNFGGTSAFTIEFWLNSPGSSGAYENIITKDDSSRAGYEIFRDTSTNNIILERRDAAGAFLNSCYVAYNSNEWTHLTYIYDGTQAVCYKNAIQDDIRANSGSMGAPTDDLNFADGQLAGGFADFKLDDVRIYNYARTQPQVAWDYNRGQATSWWKFDECSGTILYDNAKTASRSAGLNGKFDGNGTSAGTCNGSSGESWFDGKSGRFNSSLDFDGADDVAIFPNATQISLIQGLVRGYTISTWVYANTAGESNVGQIFNKGTNTYCRTENPQGSQLDVKCILDLATTDATFTVSNAFTTGGWHNVVMTYDGTTTVKIWIDGKLRGTGVGAGAVAAENNPLYVGGNGVGAGNTTAFDGKIDQVMVFPYEMNSTLIKTLYNEFSAVRFGPTSGRP